MPDKFDADSLEALVARAPRSTAGLPDVLDARGAAVGVLAAHDGIVFAVCDHAQRSCVVVRATDGDDSIAVSKHSDRGVRVTVNGHRVVLQLDPAQQLVIIARGGDDRVEVDPRLPCDVQVLGGDGDDTILTAPGIEPTAAGNLVAFWGEDGDDTLIFGAAMYGTPRADGTRFLAHGEAGSDLIQATGGNLVVDGGDGPDRIQLQGTASQEGAPQAFGADGDDIIEVRYGNAYVNTGRGNDTVYVGTFHDADSADDTGSIQNANVDITASPEDRILVAPGSVVRVQLEREAEGEP